MNASGTTDLVTIEVEDAAGNAITGLSSSAFTLSLGSGTSTGTFGSVSETSTPGTYTATFTGTLAGTATTLTTTVGGVRLASQPAITVIPGAVSATMTTASFGNANVDTLQNDPVSIVVKDAAGNAITGLSSSAFILGLSGGTSTGIFGPVAATSIPGTYSVTFTGANVGTASTLSLTISGVTIQNSGTVQVRASSLSGTKSTVSFATSTDASGTADKVTIVLKDALGNPYGDLSSSAFVFSLAGGKSTGSFGPVTETSTPGTYTASFTGAIDGTADTLTLKVAGIVVSSHPKVTVVHGVPSPSTTNVSFTTPTVVSEKGDVVKIVVKDAAGNLISGLPSSDFILSLSGGTSSGTFGKVVASSTLAGTYTAVFKGISSGTASTLTVSINGTAVASEPSIQVLTGPVSAAKSKVLLAASSVVSGLGVAVTIVLEDAAGNAITGLPSKAFAFAFSGGTSTGTVGPVTETSTPGTYEATFTGVLAGSAKAIIAKANGVAIAMAPTVKVTPGSVSGSTSKAAFAAASVAIGKTDTVTLSVKDAAGNAIAGILSSDFVLSLTGGTTDGTFGTVKPTATAGVYTVVFTPTVAGTASTLNAQVAGVTLTAQPKVTAIV
jgi:adhesin/invasin